MIGYGAAEGIRGGLQEYVAQRGRDDDDGGSEGASTAAARRFSPRATQPRRHRASPRSAIAIAGSVTSPLMSSAAAAMLQADGVPEFYGAKIEPGLRGAGVRTPSSIPSIPPHRRASPRQELAPTTNDGHQQAEGATTHAAITHDHLELPPSVALEARHSALDSALSALAPDRSTWGHWGTLAPPAAMQPPNGGAAPATVPLDLERYGVRSRRSSGTTVSQSTAPGLVDITDPSTWDAATTLAATRAAEDVARRRAGAGSTDGDETAAPQRMSQRGSSASSRASSGGASEANTGRPAEQERYNVICHCVVPLSLFGRSLTLCVVLLGANLLCIVTASSLGDIAAWMSR